MNLLVNTNPFCELCLAIPKLREAVQEQDGDSAFGPACTTCRRMPLVFIVLCSKSMGKCFSDCVPLYQTKNSK